MPLCARAIAEGDSVASWGAPGRSPAAVALSGRGPSRPTAASAIAMAQAMAVGRPGRREASRRRRVEGGGSESVVGMVCGGQVLSSAAKASAASRHQSSMAAVIQRVSS